MKEIRKIVLVLLTGLVGATLLMLLVNLLPTDGMKKHITESVKVMEREGDYHEVLPGVISSRLDNFTDSIMLLSSAHQEDVSLIERTMNIYRVRYEGKTPSEALVSYGTGEEGYTVSAYSRYWHGYQIFLKPLLMFFNYQEIRYLNICLQVILICTVIFELVKKKKEIYIFPYLLMLFSLMPVSVGLSLQFSSIFYITNIAVFVLLKWWEVLKEKKLFLLFFMIIGMLTSFMDFLTYPLVTLGVPIVFYFLLLSEDVFLRNILEIIKCSVIWAVGYAGMWAGKWGIGSLLLRENIITDAVNALLNRTSSETADVSLTFGDVMEKNLSAMFGTPIKILFLGTLFVMITILAVKTIQDKKNYFGNFHYLIVACMPVAWYMVTKNHSYMHFWFTYRELAILIFAVLMWAFVNAAECWKKDNK